MKMSQPCDHPTPEIESQSEVAVPVAAFWRPHLGRKTLRKALGSLAQLLEEMLVNEASAKQAGLLQAIDARAKVLGLIGLVVVVTFVQQIFTLALAFAMCLLLAGLSHVPLRRLLRAWLVVPLFSAAITLPALLNIFTPGQSLVTIWNVSGISIGPWAVPPILTVTDTGLYVAGRFVLRTVVCITLAILLTATTRSNRLLRGLRMLGVPALFVMLLSMMERYLSVLVHAAEEIHLAKISRSIATESLRREHAWIAAGMGALFRRTQSLGNNVNLAMVARGYTGEPRLLEETRWQLTDWAFLMIAVGFATVLLIVG